jgi:predicted  nucleic acid-binding Zn-ribbon protein
VTLLQTDAFLIQAVNSLYQEIDQLTQAYEGMQRMAKTKVYNLKALETQVVDLSTVVSWIACQFGRQLSDNSSTMQKAKAEHKFFAVSRENLGLKEQEAALKKSIDLQRSALEKARAVEDGLHAQLVCSALGTILPRIQLIASNSQIKKKS